MSQVLHISLKPLKTSLCIIYSIWHQFHTKRISFLIKIQVLYFIQHGYLYIIQQGFPKFFITLSILMTLAPKSAMIMPQNGAGASPAISTTRIPRRAILGVIRSWMHLLFTILVQLPSFVYQDGSYRTPIPILFVLLNKELINIFITLSLFPFLVFLPTLLHNIFSLIVLPPFLCPLLSFLLLSPISSPCFYLSSVSFLPSVLPPFILPSWRVKR